MQAVTRVRWASWTTRSLYTVAALCLVAPFVFSRALQSRYTVELWGSAGIMLLIACVTDWRAKRLWRAVCETDFASCLRCGYDLRASSDHGNCPECGEPFILRETKAAWMHARGDEGPDHESAD